MDYYQVLGLKKSDNPNPVQIKRAFQKKALKWHPDRMKGVNKDKTDVAHKKFTEINTAYEVLSDKTKRDNYDKYGDENYSEKIPDIFRSGNMNSGFTPAGFNSSGVNINLGGGGFGGGGFGGINNLFDRHYSFVNNLSPQENQVKEKIIKIKCSLKDLYYGLSKKYNIDGKVNVIQVKRGTKNGQQYQLNMNNYKLKFIVVELPHNLFKREENNLIYYLPIKDLHEEYDIPHIDGQKIRVLLENIPKKKSQKVIVGRGMPIKKTSAFGDLIIQFY